MAEISASIIRAVDQAVPDISSTDRGRMVAFAAEVERAAAPTPGQRAGEITNEEALQLSASKNLIGAGVKPAMSYVLDVLARPGATDGGVPTAASRLTVSDTGRALMMGGVAAANSPRPTPLPVAAKEPNPLLEERVHDFIRAAGRWLGADPKETIRQIPN